MKQLMIICLIALSVHVGSNQAFEDRVLGCGIGAVLGASLAEHIVRYNYQPTMPNEVKDCLLREAAGNCITWPGVVQFAYYLLEQIDQNISDMSVMDTVARRFASWEEKDTREVTVSRAMKKACAQLRRKMNAIHKDERWWAMGTGAFYSKKTEEASESAARVWPVGLLFCKDLFRAERIALLQSELSHRGAPAKAASVALAIGIAKLATGSSLKETVDRMLVIATRYDKKTAEKLSWAVTCAVDSLSEEEVLALCSEDIAYNALAAAVYLALKHVSNPQEAVVRAVNMHTNNVNIAAMTGALVGSYAGIDCFSEEQLKQIDRSEILVILLSRKIVRYYANAKINMLFRKT